MRGESLPTGEPFWGLLAFRLKDLWSSNKGERGWKFFQGENSSPENNSPTHMASLASGPSFLTQ